MNTTKCQLVKVLQGKAFRVVCIQSMCIIGLYRKRFIAIGVAVLVYVMNQATYRRKATDAILHVQDLHIFKRGKG